MVFLASDFFVKFQGLLIVKCGFFFQSYLPKIDSQQAVVF
ncbi:hypothetical protein HMPREF0621_1040 [Pasteurella dagmatis ATCC 43325]|uniref:Uncharacterized protein n=1 Tax=Pasteurella dagmatis ATCC 43325 TaxID=667128 RepID=C9PPW6_9PAST|nr:hypothetical protein HMPREF0621_1040 [Pasteurella dagmatis ATCC 43325]